MLNHFKKPSRSLALKKIKKITEKQKHPNRSAFLFINYILLKLYINFQFLSQKL